MECHAYAHHRSKFRRCNQLNGRFAAHGSGKRTKPFFRDSLLRVRTTFSHFGFGLFEPGTWRIPKAGIQKLNEIEFFFSDGSRISNYNKRHYDSLEESKAMSRRVQFYRFLLFVVVVRGTGLFLCDGLIHRNKRIRSQINHLLHLFIMKKIILQMLAFTSFTVL